VGILLQPSYCGSSIDWIVVAISSSGSSSTRQHTQNRLARLLSANNTCKTPKSITGAKPIPVLTWHRNRSSAGSISMSYSYRRRAEHFARRKKMWMTTRAVRITVRRGNGQKTSNIRRDGRKEEHCVSLVHPSQHNTIEQH